MQFASDILSQPVSELHSGKFYWIQVHSRCYRINEVDHYLKNLNTQVVGYLDKSERFHYYNHIESQHLALTSVENLMQIPNIQKIDCFEFAEQSIAQIHKQSMASAPKLGKEKQNWLLLKKVVDECSARASSDQGTTYTKAEWEEKYLSDYIDSRDLES